MKVQGCFASTLTSVVVRVALLRTLLRTAREPSSRVYGLGRSLGFP